MGGGGEEAHENHARATEPSIFGTAYNGPASILGWNNGRNQCPQIILSPSDPSALTDPSGLIERTVRCTYVQYSSYVLYVGLARSRRGE